MSEVNILHLLNGEQYAGLERVVDKLAERAPSHGYRFHLVCLKDGVMPDRLQTQSARLHFVRMRSRFDLSGILAIRQIAQRQQCCLIHSHTVRSAMIARALKLVLPLPWVHHVHSPARYESENGTLNFINAQIECRVLPKAQRILAVSPAMRDYVFSTYGLSPAVVRVIENGVDIETDRPRRRPSPDVTLTVGMVGLFRPRKGVETLLEALQALVSKGFTLMLRLVGAFASESYLKDFQILVRRLGLEQQVELAGFRHHIRDELARLDVFAMPSLYGEGLPMALLEAMAMGCPVVASDVAGIGETLDGGACALLVPPGDPESLAAAIERLLLDADLRARLGALAQERQRQHYTAEGMASRIFDVYGECLQSVATERAVQRPSPSTR